MCTKPSARRSSPSWIDENADMLQVTINFCRVVELGGYTDDHEMMTDVEVEIESEVY